MILCQTDILYYEGSSMWYQRFPASILVAVEMDAFVKRKCSVDVQ